MSGIKPREANSKRETNAPKIKPPTRSHLACSLAKSNSFRPSVVPTITLTQEETVGKIKKKRFLFRLA